MVAGTTLAAAAAAFFSAFVLGVSLVTSTLAGTGATISLARACT